MQVRLWVAALHDTCSRWAAARLCQYQPWGLSTNMPIHVTFRPRARCSYSSLGCGQKQKLRASSTSRYCAVASSLPRKWTSAAQTQSGDAD